MNQSSHPSATTISAYLAGCLSEVEADGVGDHLGTCDACSRSADEADRVTGGLVADLRTASRVGVSGFDSGCFRAVEAACRLLPQDEPPAELGGYRLLRDLGAGGFGRVYLGQDKLMGRFVAIKVLHPHRRLDPRVGGRFVKELAALGQMPPHANVVLGLHAGEENDQLYLVMEYVEGEPLNRLIATRGRVPADAACAIARQVAAGLAHVAAHGLVHRDVKPHNIMVTAAGGVKLLDLGISRLTAGPHDPAGGVTETGQMLGTLDYIAPEQTIDARNVDIRADIYSLGCTLFHMLAGCVPYPGRDALEKVRCHREEPLPSLGGDPGLETVLRRMTAKNPADRFQTPTAVAEALVRYADPATVLEVFNPPAEISGSPESETTRPPKAGVSRRRVILGTAAGAVGAGVFGLGVWARIATRGAVAPVSPGPVGRGVAELGGVKAVAVADDGRLLALAGGRLRVFQAESGHEIGGCPLAFDPVVQQGGIGFAGGVAVVATNQGPDKARLVWVNTTDWSATVLQVSDAAFTGLAVTDGGAFTADTRGRARRWRGHGGEFTDFSHPAVVRGISANRGGGVVTGCDDGRVRVWEAEPGHGPLSTLSGPPNPFPGDWVAVGSDAGRSQVVAVTRSDSSAWVWMPGRGGAVVHTPLPAGSGLTAAAVGRGGRLLWVGTADGDTFGWDVVAGREVARHQRHTAAVSAVAVSVNGRWACSASEEDRVGWVYRLPELFPLT